MAAGDPRRCLAQPADAPAAQARPAGTPDRPDRARLRPGGERPRSDRVARKKAKRRRDGCLALPAAACRRSRRKTPGRPCAIAAGGISRSRAHWNGQIRRRRSNGRSPSRPLRRGPRGSASPKSRRSSAIPIRSMRGMCCGSIRSIRSMPIRGRRSAARSCMRRFRSSRANIPRRCPRTRSTNCSRTRRRSVREHQGLSKFAGDLEAALRAGGALVHRRRNGAAEDCRAHARGERRQDQFRRQWPRNSR
jgi:hypothetical protein